MACHAKSWQLYKEIELIPGLSQKQTGAIEQAKKLIKVNLYESVDIQGEYFCLYGKKNDFSGSVTVVMAHWDPQQLIDPYVRYWCRHFKKLGWRVVLSSAQPVHVSTDLADEQDWIDAIVCRQCPGYDFTSWKAALHCFPSLLACDTLIFCNDSIFGPIGSLEDVHGEMQKVPCDFWGFTSSTEILPHIQSYYMVFHDTVLQHKAFKTFFDAVPLSDNRDTAISFEISLALWLALHGLRPAAAFSSTICINATYYFWDVLIQVGIPMIKRDCLRVYHSSSVIPTKPYNWSTILAGKQYPVDLIFNYFRRMGEDLSSYV